MADRTIAVRLILNATGYAAEAKRAAQQTRDIGSEAEKLAQKREAFNTLGAGMIAVGASAAIAVGLAVSKFAEFDSAMSEVQASTHESTANMGLLRDAALEAGAETVFSATEAANAIDELAKAGISTADVLGGALTGSLDLAAAGGLGVARAAEITSTTLQQFKLRGESAAQVADLLAAGAGKAMGSVDDLAQGLKFVGPVAASMGVSLEETVGTMALFAQQGILGEQAGTSLRGVLSSLTAPSKQAATEIERLGLNLYDSQGNFLGLQNAAGELAGAYREMDDESRNASLGIIFGRETLTAATALYEGGAEGVQKWTEAVDDSGYAAETARIKLDNLRGDIEALGGSVDTALIQSGSAANGVLRSLVQTTTFLVNGIGGAPAPVLAVGTALGVVAAAVGLTGGAALLGVPKVIAFKAALAEMGISARAAAVGVGVASAAIAGVTLIIGQLIANAADSDAAVSSLADTFDAATGAVTDYTRKMLEQRLAQLDNAGVAEKAGLSYREMADALIEGGDALEVQKNRLDEWRAAGNDPINQAGALAGVLDQVSGELERGSEEWRQNKELTDAAAASQAEATGAAAGNAEALGELTGAARAADESISDLADQIRGFGSAQFDVNSATRSFEAAIDDLSGAVDRNGQSLDIGTEAGRENQAALEQIAKATLDLSGATLVQTGSQEEASAALYRGRDAFLAAARQAGYSKEAAEQYADQLGLIPDNVTTAFFANTEPAKRSINDYMAIYGTRIGTIEYRASLPDLNGAASGNGRPGFAFGGYTGGGGKYDVAGVVHRGEFVSTQETLARGGNRAALEYMHAGGTFGASGYRSATPVATLTSASSPAIYVQNPFTGEYLLARVDARAGAAITRADRSDQLTTRMGSI